MELPREGVMLDTKGCCFLCLESEIKKESKSISIRCLLRHLQVTFKDSLFKRNVLVDLCESCEATLKGFSTVFEELEKVQMKMNRFLEEINESISGPGKDLKRVKTYSKRMKDDPFTLQQLAFVDNLRNKLAVKSLEKRIGPVPKVTLTKTEVQMKEEEESDEEMIENDKLKSFGESSGDEEELHDPLSLDPSPSWTESEKEEFIPIEATSSADTNPGNKNVYYLKNEETGMYHCKKCKKPSKKRYNIIRHYKMVHLKKKYKCNICDVTYADTYRLKRHKETCGGSGSTQQPKEDKFVCKLCGKQFGTKKGLGIHRRDVHLKLYICKFCNKKYTKSFNLKRHVKAVHLGTAFFCQFCNKKLIYEDYLRTHEGKCKLKGKIKTEVEEQTPANNV